MTRDRPPGRSAIGLFLTPKKKHDIGVIADLGMESC